VDLCYFSPWLEDSVKLVNTNDADHASTVVIIPYAWYRLDRALLTWKSTSRSRASGKLLTDWGRNNGHPRSFALAKSNGIALIQQGHALS
jgi:hypothetical protein